VRAERYAAGRHVLRWNGQNENGARTGSGVYFAIVRAGPWSAREKLVRVR
jgi:flagellar hook assembly protein FlgD